MGPESRSSRERFVLDGDAARPDCFLEAAFFDDLFFDTFFAVDLPAAFFRDTFFGAAFFAFFLLAPLREADFFAAFLLPAFLVDFLVVFPADFLATFFFADLRAAGFRRAADFFFDALLVEDFFLVLLTLRFFPEALLPIFLPAPALREGARVLAVPARFRFLLAAFLAGMIDSCRSEKNAELYIGCPDMEAREQGFSLSRRDRQSGRAKPPRRPRLPRPRDHLQVPTRPSRATKVQWREAPTLCIRRRDRSLCLGAATIVLSDDIHYTIAI